MPALRFLPPLGWTLLIAWFSTDSWGAAHTSAFSLPLLRRLLPWAAPEQIAALHWLARKTAHAVEYGVLAASWRWALASRETWRGCLVPLALSIVTAALDELHQATTLTRAGSPADVLLDAAGAAMTLLAVSHGIRPVLDRLTGALLWLAAAGGTALLALNWGIGAPSGWLWWSVPSAWVALAAWLMRPRHA
jgi:VanZ family protein